MDLWTVDMWDGKPHGVPRIVKADMSAVEPIGFSRSGSFFYVHVRSDEDIFAVDMDPVTGKRRGAAARIAQAFLGRNERAAWSPDGKWVAFHSRRGHSRYGPGAVCLVVRSVETGEEKVFPSNLGFTQRPVRLHDGAAILEVARGPQGASFHRADIATGKFVLLQSTGVRFNTVASLAPDDKTVYLGGARLNLSTGEVTQVYSPPEGLRVTGSSLSPDGKNLAMMLTSLEGQRRQAVAVVGIDGNGFRKLVEAVPPEIFVPVVGLTWSPDSRWVYFVRIKQPESELWRVPAAGGPAEYTGIAAKGLKHIHMSADGTKLAFTAGERTNPELWVLENVLPALKASR